MGTTSQITKLNETELKNNVPFEASWHQEYSDSAYIFIGNLPKQLVEEDILAIFSQYGVPTDIRLVRDKETKESRGFAFLKYEDQLSTVLAVDNFNGISVLDRYIRVDHCYYKPHVDEDGNEVVNEFDKRVQRELQKDFITYDEEKVEEKQKNAVDETKRIEHRSRDHGSDRKNKSDNHDAKYRSYRHRDRSHRNRDRDQGSERHRDSREKRSRSDRDIRHRSDRERRHKIDREKEEERGGHKDNREQSDQKYRERDDEKDANSRLNRHYNRDDEHIRESRSGSHYSSRSRHGDDGRYRHKDHRSEDKRKTEKDIDNGSERSAEKGGEKEKDKGENVERKSTADKESQGRIELVKQKDNSQGLDYHEEDIKDHRIRRESVRGTRPTFAHEIRSIDDDENNTKDKDNGGNEQLAW